MHRLWYPRSNSLAKTRRNELKKYLYSSSLVCKWKSFEMASFDLSRTRKFVILFHKKKTDLVIFENVLILIANFFFQCFLRFKEETLLSSKVFCNFFNKINFWNKTRFVWTDSNVTLSRRPENGFYFDPFSLVHNCTVHVCTIQRWFL